MDDRAWTTGDGPKALFDWALVWLREHQVLLPGVSTLAQLVARVRDTAMQRPWDTSPPRSPRHRRPRWSICWRSPTGHELWIWNGYAAARPGCRARVEDVP